MEDFVCKDDLLDAASRVEAEASLVLPADAVDAASKPPSDELMSRYRELKPRIEELIKKEGGDNRGTDPAAPAAEISRPAAAQPRPAPADHRHIRLY